MQNTQWDASSGTRSDTQSNTQSDTQSNIKSRAVLDTLPAALSDIVSNIAADVNAEAGVETSPLLPWIFNLEGTFLGLLGEAPDQVTAIVIEVDHEQMAIKLPKNLREAVKRAVRRRVLKLGARVRCIGRSQLDFAAGVIELKAYCLFPNTAKTALFAPPSSADKQPATIMVCHKSGCKKRGGRQLVEALERALTLHQLRDRVEIQYTGCQKRCSKAPGLVIMPGKHRYDGLSPEAIPALIERHFC